MKDENTIDAQVLSMAADLKTDVSPERDLWPEIEASVAATSSMKRKRRWTPMLAQAAAIVLLVGASSGVTYMAMQDQVVAGPVIAHPDRVFEQTSFANRYELGEGFQSARDTLVAELDDELEKLSPEARLTIENNLQVIQLSISEMNAALDENPDNALLQERVLRSYRDELALIRRVSGLARNVMLRNDI